MIGTRRVEPIASLGSSTASRGGRRFWRRPVVDLTVGKVAKELLHPRLYSDAVSAGRRRHQSHQQRGQSQRAGAAEVVLCQGFGCVVEGDVRRRKGWRSHRWWSRWR